MSKLKLSLEAKDVTSLMNKHDGLMPDKSKKRTPEEKSRKLLKEEETIVDLELAVTKEKFKNKDKPKRMLNEEKLIVDLELAVTKEKFKKTSMNERKCVECEENGFQEYEGKLRCEKHHSEAKRKANIEFEKRQNLIKYGLVTVAIIGVIVGTVVIYQFVANL